MSKKRRIVVVGKQRKVLDAGLMAHVILALAKQMQGERQAEISRKRSRRGTAPQSDAPKERS
ncbi:MAG: hypothetical protein ACJ73S_05290 [Mycobacteriales bacterium]